ncbi:MAG: NUDIX hydrolase [Eubacteriales bacterium]|jgi:ADP-ribose pyrophosphatase
MAVIDKITQLTKNRFLSMYAVEGHNSKGHHSDYRVASRAQDIDHLMITTGKIHTDGVIIYALYGEKHDRVVLIRQFRYPAGTYIYELPAGLTEEGEDFHDGAVREMHEETGLSLHPLHPDPMYEAPRFTTIGMTDEACAIVYGYADGKISDRFEEPAEEISVVLADRDECRRILKEEPVALNAAYCLYHFLEDEEPFRFLHTDH